MPELIETFSPIVILASESTFATETPTPVVVVVIFASAVVFDSAVKSFLLVIVVLLPILILDSALTSEYPAKSEKLSK